MNASTYKNYVENHKVPRQTEHKVYMEDLCAASSKFNGAGELVLSLEDLFRYDPRAMLGLLFAAPRFADREVRLTLEEAFREYIDPIDGGFTQAGVTKFGEGCGWLSGWFMPRATPTR